MLEIGAGTGYNAALLAHLVGDSGHVVTLDIDEDLVFGAREHLRNAGCGQVTVVQHTQMLSKSKYHEVLL